MRWPVAPLSHQTSRVLMPSPHWALHPDHAPVFQDEEATEGSDEGAEPIGEGEGTDAEGASDEGAGTEPMGEGEGEGTEVAGTGVETGEGTGEGAEPTGEGDAGDEGAGDEGAGEAETDFFTYNQPAYARAASTRQHKHKTMTKSIIPYDRLIKKVRSLPERTNDDRIDSRKLYGTHLGIR